MATYTITNRPTLLEEGDRVIFTVKGKTNEYSVRSSYLNNVLTLFRNNEVFCCLHLDKEKFVNSSYGYESRGGSWPESKTNDFPALTRLVNALFHTIAEREPDQMKPAPASMTSQQHLEAYLSTFSSERFRSKVKEILAVLETVA